MSHQLAGMAAANGLAIVPDGAGLAAGDLLEVILFGPIEPLGAVEDPTLG
jgi:molybdopterin biosynthesis enzyme